MPQSDGRNTLKRMEFAFKGKSFKFTLNPEEYTQDEPSRSTVTQTKGGAWVDDFGAGLPTIYMKGTTGFKKGSGADKFKELRNFIREYMNNGTPGAEVKDELTFHNYTDEESWIVHTDPTAFRLLRSKSNPLLYMYEIRLVCLRPAQYPKPAAAPASGGVARTVGTPAAFRAPISIETPDDIAASHIAQTFDMSQFAPNRALTTYVSDIRTLSDGRVQESTIVNTPRIAFRSFAAPASSPVELKFDAVVSQLTLETLQRLQAGEIKLSNRHVTKESFLGKIQDIKNSYLPSNVSTGLKTVLAEYLSILLCLKNEPDKFSRYVSESDVRRLGMNTRWVSEELAKQKKPDYDLISELRWLERSSQYLLNSRLFGNDVYKTLQDYVDILD